MSSLHIFRISGKPTPSYFYFSILHNCLGVFLGIHTMTMFFGDDIPGTTRVGNKENIYS